MRGKIIGTNGEDIKQLMSETGTSIEILPNKIETDSGLMLRLQITGTEAGCSEALIKIEKILDSER